MTVTFCTDEHVPSVFITTLRSSGYEVIKANTIFGEGTNDRRLLEHCAENDYIFITHDKKDFSGPASDGIDHAGIIIYTNPVLLRDNPDRIVRTLERVLGYYPPKELSGEQIWLDQWYSK